MPSDVSKFRLGLFILSGLGVLVAALIVLGGARLLQPKFRAVTVFDESVQGLEVGSPVKMRGLQIGKVSSMRMRQQDPYIEVEMELYLQSSGFGSRDQIEKRLAEEVDKSAACALQYAGITGMKYIEIDYDSDPSKPRTRIPQPLASTLPPGAFYIPSVTSTLSSISTNVMNMVDKLSQQDISGVFTQMQEALRTVTELTGSEDMRQSVANFRAVSGKLDGLLAKVDKQMGDDGLSKTLDELQKTLREIRDQTEKQGGNLTAAIDKIQDTADSVNKLARDTNTQLTEAKLAETAAGLRKTLSEMQESLKAVSETGTRYQQLAGKIETAIADADLKESSASFRGMMDAGQKSATDLGQIRRDLALSLAKLNTTLDAVESWVEYLDEDPASLLRGKQKETSFRKGE